MRKRTNNSTKQRSYKTSSNIHIKEVYNAEDLPANIKSRLAVPGAYPFTRGIYADMYRGRFWTMRQYAGFGTASETNKRYRFLLEQGTTGLSVAFDLPTQMGRDSDHAFSKGEIGKVGVAVSTLDDMRTLLKGLPLEKISISMTINSTAAILLGMLLIVAKEQGVSWKKIQGTVQNDILKEYIARGTYIYPPAQALRIVTDIFSFCAESVPKWNTISISGYHMREAGCTAAQELAFTFSNAVTYVEAALRAGLKIDEFAPRLAFFFNCHNEFFEEIAKFRVARKIWAQLMKERFKASGTDSMKFRFHTQTAGSSLTAQQPLNNIVRTSIQAMAAVLGGTQSLHTNSFDEALGLPTEESARVALRTQQIIAHESGIAQTADPLAGSYYLESLSESLEKEALKIMATVDKMGGMLKAIEKGYPQEEIERSAYDYQKSMENKERIIVGVNQFVLNNEELPAPQMLNRKTEKEQLSRLRNFKAKRSQQKLRRGMQDLSRDVKAGKNLMQSIIKALNADLTLGEISDVLRGHFGEYK